LCQIDVKDEKASILLGECIMIKEPSLYRVLVQVHLYDISAAFRLASIMEILLSTWETLAEAEGYEAIVILLQDGERCERLLRSLGCLYAPRHSGSTRTV